MIDHSEQTILNPTLKTALSSLDLDLESELSRYKRLKNKNAAHTASPPQVIPLESLNLQPVTGLVHQPEDDLSHSHEQETSPPDDYLASSARLLQSLADNDYLNEQPRIFLNPVKTAWGFSSLVMLFFATGLLGLAFIPQEIWSNVPIIRGLVSSLENEEEIVATPKIIEDNNPSESEFLQLNLHNLSTLQVEKNQSSPVQETPVESVSPVVETPETAKANPTPNEDLAKALLAPILNQIENKLQEQADTYTATAAISATQLNRSYYYVFADYKGDRTLAAARAVIRDAYLVEFPTGLKIQFGAFVKQQDANNLVQQLQTRGIAGTVFNPTQ